MPTGAEQRRYYEVVWQSQNVGGLVLVTTLLYTGVRVSELVRIDVNDVDESRLGLSRCGCYSA